MKEGFYFKRKKLKHDVFEIVKITKDTNYLCRILKDFVIDDTFPHHEINKDDELFNFPMPNASNIRINYCIGDMVYFVPHDVTELYFGIIFGFNEYSYRIEHNVLWHYSIPKNWIIPYNWYILDKNCREAIRMWSLCSIRLKIYKDLRILIGKYIWKTKNDSEWGLGVV
jgi:hypothetical protein